MAALLPPTVDYDCAALRGMYQKYDHLSDLSATYSTPPAPEDYTKGGRLFGKVSASALLLTTE